MGVSGITEVTKRAADAKVAELSRSSAFGQNQARLNASRQERITALSVKLASLKWSQQESLQDAAESELLQIELSRTTKKVCCVVDMDSFFAACHMRDTPELEMVPMAVGGMGMLSTSNYIARQFGVRAGMPGYLARELCPQLVFVKPDYDVYVQASKQVEAIVSQYDASFKGASSLDEFYLDLTKAAEERLLNKERKRNGQGQGSVVASSSSSSSSSSSRSILESAGTTDLRWTRLFQCAQELVQEIRRRIKQQTKLTASAGIAPNFLLAKVASNEKKPDGQMCVPSQAEGVLSFLEGMPVGKIHGVGKVFAQELKEVLSITTVGEIRQHAGSIAALFSDKTKQFLFHLSRGITRDNSTSPTEDGTSAGAGDCDENNLVGTTADCDAGRKSIGQERSFRATTDKEFLLSCLQKYSDSIGRHLLSKELLAGKLTLKLKRESFIQTQVSKDFPLPTCASGQIFATATLLLRSGWEEKGRPPLRLVGISVSALTVVVASTTVGDGIPKKKSRRFFK
jgi:DNA polymerase kappa